MGSLSSAKLFGQSPSGITASATAPTAFAVTLTPVAATVTAASATATTAQPDRFAASRANHEKRFKSEK